jgi:hypothetical protein
MDAMECRRRIAKAIARWEASDATFFDVAAVVMDVIDEDSVGEAMNALPESLRGEMADWFEGYRTASSDAELLTISGGVYRWEREADPVLREKMKRESEADDARRQLRFMNVTLPAIKRWLAENRPLKPREP